MTVHSRQNTKDFVHSSLSSQNSNLTQPARLIAAPAKALQNIVTKQLSGRLTIGDPTDSSIFWRVYVGQGKIHFATSTMGQWERLNYLLQWYYPELATLSKAELSSQAALQYKSDYEFLCQFWQTGKLSLPQLRQLLLWLSQEALIQILALPQATIQFEKTVKLDPLVLSVSLKELIIPTRGFINQWGQLSPQISSPFQRPMIRDIEQLPKILWQRVKDVEFIKSLLKLIKKQLSLYEIASCLKTDTFGIAELLQPAVLTGAVRMNSYSTHPQSISPPLIACIDDSKTIQRNVQLVLEAAGYRVLKLSESVNAISTLAKYQPALILMDINMPEMNGYDLCRLLRQSPQLQKIPVVMLTGRDGMIDKLRAKMVGATDYMTKPFHPQQLIAIVQNHLSPTSKHHPSDSKMPHQFQPV